MCLEEIILEIEDTPVLFKKDKLIANSDYFKAMLEGNFVERHKERIKLEGVNLKAMNIILTLICDESFLIENEDLLPVLQVACMLQFEKIKKMCLDKVTELLCPKNCLEIWHVTEQLDLKPLFLKAKAMALEEFLQIKDNEYILELNLNQIYYYLGHIYLKTDELSVFQTAIKWWYENSEQHLENSTKVLLKLLSCINYQNLQDEHLKEIMIYPDISSNSEVTQILSCILLIKNCEYLRDFSETCKETAKLLYKSQARCRLSPLFPCLLMNLNQPIDESTDRKDGKKAKVSDDSENNIVEYDKYKRRRYYQILDVNKKTTVYYDAFAKEYRRLIDIDGEKSQNLTGYKLMGYKEFVFMYGGEYLIGKGNWNRNFWVYDMIRERWERKSVIPSIRRHFETCMVGSNLYIVGGAGMYRLLQENMFWYNYKEDKWSAEFELPCASRQTKCCNFLNKLFILNINGTCGYFFNEENFVWDKFNIIINDAIIDSQLEYSVFSYKNSLYIKGKKLIEFLVKDMKLVEVSVRNITNLTCDQMEVAVCNNTVYTLYKYKFEDDETYSLETYNLETADINFVFKDIPSDSVIDVEGDQYTISASLNLFSFQCYNLVERNILINNCFQ